MFLSFSGKAEENPIDELTKIYIRINQACKEDETILEECRNNFKKLEEGDKYCVDLWNKFKNLSLKEFQKVYDLLGSKFDSWNGEAFYSDKMQPIVDELKEKGLLVESRGAQVVDLEEYGIFPERNVYLHKSKPYAIITQNIENRGGMAAANHTGAHSRQIGGPI